MGQRGAEINVVVFTICSINTRFFTCLIYDYKDSWKFMWNTCESDSFHGQGRYGIKRYFHHLLAGKTVKIMVYLQICE